MSTPHLPVHPRREGLDTRRMLRAALAAAGQGWPVFPLRSGEKTPALHSAACCPGTGVCGQSHQGWEQRATTDPDQISRWWRHRAHNVGVACGPAGLVVLDLDVRKGPVPPGREPGAPRHGEHTLSRLAARAGHPVPVDTLTVATPSGGAHLYFQAPPGEPIRNSVGERGARGLGPLIDVRAAGGYIVAAGSVLHGRGMPYRRHPGRPARPVPLPGWLATALTRPAPPPARPAPPGAEDAQVRHVDAYLRAAVAGETTAVRGAVAGTRAFVVFKAAARLGELVGARMLAEPDAYQALTAAAAVHDGVAGWSAREAHHHITNGLAAGQTRPRRPRGRTQRAS